MGMSLSDWLSYYSPKPGLLVVRPDPNPKIANMFRFETAQQTVAADALIGNNALAAKEADIKLQSLYYQNGGSCSSDTIQAWLNSPATGLTTLLDMALETSGWNPLVDDPANAGRFISYVQILEACPLIHLEMADSAQYHRTTTDWNRTIDDIVGLFVGVATEDLDKIKKTLTDLADAATSRHNTRQTQVIFADQVPQTDSDAIHHSIYTSTIQLEVDDHGKSTTRQVDYKISRLRFEFRTDVWDYATAQTICQHHFCSLNNWLDKNQTPKGDIPNPQPIISQPVLLSYR